MDLARNFLIPQDRARALVGGEQERRDAVDLDPVALLRHREVSAAQSGLDVGDGEPGAGPRPRQRRVRVSVDEDGIGL